MKAKLFFLLIILSSQVSFAQINKGAILIGGSVSFGSSNSDYDDPPSYISSSDRKGFSFGLQPSVGIFLSEKWRLGGGLSYSHSLEKTTIYMAQFDGTHEEVELKETRNFYSINASMTRYARVKDNLFFTLSFSGGAGTGNIKADYNDTPGIENAYTSKNLSFDISPGLAYFFSNRWVAVANIGSMYARFEWIDQEKPENAIDNFTSNFGVSLQANTFYVGVQYLLRNGDE